jgi:hypothetical protein
MHPCLHLGRTAKAANGSYIFVPKGVEGGGAAEQQRLHVEELNAELPRVQLRRQKAAEEKGA